MKYSIDKTWFKFERWVKRYRRVCRNAVDELIEGDNWDFDRWLFLKKWYEHDQDLEFQVTESDLLERIDDRINFLRGYLVDISFDGPEFMANNSDILAHQYPSRCNNSIGVWLEQDREGEIEAGAYPGFQEFDVSFFCKSIKGVDLASMSYILPFHRMFVRRPRGQTWDASSVKRLVHDVKEDLEFDFKVKVQPDVDQNAELLRINFTWEEWR